MKKDYIFAILVLLIPFASICQVSINNDGSDPDPSALLDLQSTQQGLLIPRMSTDQMEAILNPVMGLMIFNLDNNRFYFFDAEAEGWREIAFGSGFIPDQWNCGEVFIDNRDGQSYSTVQIGEQCWMAENLKIGTQINSSINSSNDETIEKYCYNDDAEQCNLYGGLYQWREMMEWTTTAATQGICPPGWYVPTDDDLCALENYADEGTISCSEEGWRGSNAGLNLKS